MTSNLNYTLQEINSFIVPGIEFTIPEDVRTIINYLSGQVGSSGISSRIFIKQNYQPNTSINSQNSLLIARRKKGNRGNVDSTTEEWESIRTFQATKIEQKTGIDGEIDSIRLLLNKLTDKTFLDIRDKIFNKLNEVCSNNVGYEELIKIGTHIYDMCSSNKFYSKPFADLFAELCNKYEWIVPIFEEKCTNIMEQYNNIVYIDSENDYDGFCNMNKQNDKRRSVTTFLMSLANNGFIQKKMVVVILKKLLEMVTQFIDVSDKKNEVDELTENIAILFNKRMICEVINEMTIDCTELYINEKTIIDTITILSTSKSKDHKSLSNKAIFKYMDLIEM